MTLFKNVYLGHLLDKCQQKYPWDMSADVSAVKTFLSGQQTYRTWIVDVTGSISDLFEHGSMCLLGNITYNCLHKMLEHCCALG
jgi:hypothetical protein